MQIFGEIFELVGCKIFSKKLLKLKGTHESSAGQIWTSIKSNFFSVIYGQ